ncbi:MAG: phosphonate C-P lyase system protein PhnH [Pseudomonadota bacterium]
MQAQSLSGGFKDTPIDAAQAFRTLLQAMARPGLILGLRGSAPPDPLSISAGTALLTLCDPTTPVHLAGDCDTQPLRDWIGFHTGAPISTPEHADFAVGSWADLQPLSAYRIGQPDYPDRSATLLVECAALSAEGAILTGPGIETSAQFALPELAAFQANRARYPLGLDFYFTAGDRIAGLPRTTIVEAS